MSHRPPPQKIPKAFMEDPEVRAYINELVSSVYHLWVGVQQNVGFYGNDPVAQGAALTTSLTPITHTSPGTPDYAVQDLTTSSPYGFVTKDEGNTVLSVILNLQTRVDELEARLDSSTGIGVFN